MTGHTASTHRIVQTGKGQVIVSSFCNPEYIREFDFDSRFGIYPRYKSLYTRRESLEVMAADPDANIVLATSKDKHIVGFGLLVHPEPEDRWYRIGRDIMMELKAIEISRDWRSCGLTRPIMDQLMSHPHLEDRIVYLVGYSWTWDLDGTGESAQEYRKKLFHIFEPFGFREQQTNDPNICLKPENMLMARIGSRISEKIRNRFKWLRFGVEE
jgi:acetoin utilization protein AcuA